MNDKLLNMVRMGHNKALNKQSADNMRRLLAAFRAGQRGGGLQTRGGAVTGALEFAYLSGKSLANGDRKGAMTLWRNARFLQGRTSEAFLYTQ